MKISKNTTKYRFLEIIHHFSHELEYTARNLDKINDVAILEDMENHYQELLADIFSNLRTKLGEMDQNI